jgi:glycosyltransferase involved in cell wall biosynthesis
MHKRTNHKKYALLTPSIGISKGGIQTWSYYILKLLEHCKMKVDYASILEMKLKGIVKMLYFNISANTYILTIWHMFFFVIFAYILSVLHIKNYSFYILFHGDEILKLNKLQRIFLKLILHSKNIHTIANSNATSNLLNKILNIYAEKVIHPFIEINITKKQRKDSKAYHFLTLTRLVKRKNIANVLKAMKILKERGLKFHYCIAGRGSEYENIVRLVKRLHIEDSITFLGIVNEEQKKFLYSWTDLFILPSKELKHSIEGYGIVFIEANSYGVPVISGNTGGMKEAVIDGITGFHCNGTVNDIVEKISIAIKTSFDIEQIYRHAEKHDYRNQLDFINFIKGD